MEKIKNIIRGIDVTKYLIKTGVYIVIFFVILYFMWQFLLDESLFDVLMQK